LFHTYSQFASTPSIPAKPSEEETRVESRLNEILEQVRLHD
jgi:Golgi SNAP receptor complex protein 1